MTEQSLTNDYNELLADSLQVENYLKQICHSQHSIIRLGLEQWLFPYLRRYQRASPQVQFKIFLFYQTMPDKPNYQKVENPTIQIKTDVHEVGVNKTTEMEVETPQLKMNMHTVAYDKPETPEAPQVVKSSVLPMTGDETSTASILASIAGVFMTLGGLVGVRKRKED